MVVSLYGLVQSPPHGLDFEVDLGPRFIYLHGTIAGPIIPDVEPPN